MENWPVFALLVMIITLLISPSGMTTVCPITALLILVFSGSTGHDLLARAAPNIVTVLVVMSATQLAIRKLLQSGLGDRISVWIAEVAAHRCLRRVPAAVLLPLIFVPGAMFMAMALHNITSVLVLTPLAITLCSIFNVPTAALLSAMLIASNLGGASMAFGDTPAIIQRELWEFSPATFAAAMLPRNLVILAILTSVSSAITWFPTRREKMSWIDVYNRLKARDQMTDRNRYSASSDRSAVIGAVGLAVFLVAQFVFPSHSLVTASLVLAGLVIFTPREKRMDAYSTLGLDAILVISSLFMIGAAVEHAPLIRHLAGSLKAHAGSGAIEVCAYFLTTGISADGSAATLAPIVHRLSGGTMLSAWQLASGICAGSSTLLTAASAGPIINTISRNAGKELTFRDYARFGCPFSVLMMAIYLIIDTLCR